MPSLVLQRVTFTGADERADLTRLTQIALAHPWAEFALLVSPSRAGTERYPGPGWRARFLRSAVPLPQRALHLCGAAVDQFLAEDEALFQELDRAGRVQLNFDMGRLTDQQLQGLRSQFHEWLGFAPDTQFILQYNAANAYLPDLMRGAGAALPNVSFLADSSGGRGIAPRTWPRPLTGYFTAYAGGIGPGSIARTLEQLQGVADETAIDMETSLRTNEQFDLTKVQATIDELLSVCELTVLADGRQALRYGAE
jgi:hypothetical protein